MCDHNSGGSHAQLEQVVLTMLIGQGSKVALSYMSRAFGLISVNSRCSRGV